MSPEFQRSPTTSTEHVWALGRLDAKVDLLLERDEQRRAILYQLMTLLIQLLDCMKTTPRSQPPPVVAAPPTVTATPSRSRSSLAKAAILKIGTWLLEKAVGFLLPYLLPAGLLIWAMAKHHLTALWRFVIG